MASKRLSVRKIALYLFLCMSGAFAIWLLANLVSGSPTRIKIDETTTYITAPSKDDPSRVDYVEYANQRLSEEVTPENNAVAVLVRFVPQLGTESFSSRFLQLLDIEESSLAKVEMIPPDKPMEKIIEEKEAAFKENNSWTEDAQEKLRSQLYTLLHQPWDADQYPTLKHWLDSQNEILDDIRAAAHRPKYYSPIVCDETSGLVSALLPVCQKTRELSRGLALRAMHHLHQGNIVECQADLIAIRKLAIHLSKAPFHVQKLIAFSNLGIARRAEFAMAQHPKVTVEDLKTYLTRIRKATLSGDCLKDTLFFERFIILDAVSKIAYYGADGLQQIMAFGRRGEESVAGRVITDMAISMIDWNIVLQEINLYFDRIQKVLESNDLPNQTKQSAEIEKELVLRAEESHNRLNIALAILGGRKAKGKLAANHVVASFMPSVSIICKSRNDAIVQERIIRCLMGIEIFRKQNDKLPDRLSDISDLDAIDNEDLYTNKAFAYDAASFPNIYSFGPNQEDDQGRSRFSEPSGDDVPLDFE